MEKSKKIFKSVLKWLGIAFNVILVAVVLVNAYTIAMRFITKKEVIPVFGIATALVETGSMQGENDDSIDGFTLIFTVKSKEYKVGDVITFDTGSSVPTTHRIIEITDEGYITQGDANNSKDTTAVKPEQVIGKVFFTIPGVGYFVHFMKTPFGMLILVLVCFFIIAAPSFFKSSDEEKSKNENENAKKNENENAEKNTSENNANLNNESNIT